MERERSNRTLNTLICSCGKPAKTRYPELVVLLTEKRKEIGALPLVGLNIGQKNSLFDLSSNAAGRLKFQLSLIVESA